MKARTIRLGLAAAMLGAGATLAAAMQPAHEAHEARADIKDAARHVVAHARLTQETDGVRLRVTATGGLPEGVHGIHIHMTGQCEAPGFTSAGGHWNPTAHQHGTLNPQGPHMGDLPNLTIDRHGRGTLDTVIAGGMLQGGANPLLDADGAAVVIHAGPDDYRSDPAGNSGGRVACGVIG
ncbi:superoxide dismutase family protein [Sphingosinicella ginsenosidimutans]|uniref:Superoxide dismutase [Cu-Zn] n=1 Tax=Allosphingosinicella ginsenosidimutans TaxID=1176539 RepID=A0A5C6TU90_9SPHN|nr:superoxide dismutase family protein [Sphingosinicella ginsenosidimutans]TXC63952.1 superoxide dismutase family protein [Sphingosinicella ginsenosidimutans]